MARPALASLTTLAALCTMCLLGHKTETYGLAPHNACTFGLAESSSPAANILFMGNSRSGAAIDAGYIEDQINTKSQVYRTVERLALTDNDYPAMRILTERYLKSRGAPDTVILQIIHETSKPQKKNVGKPVLTRRALSYGNMDQLLRIQLNAKYNSNSTLSSEYIAQGYRSMPAALVGAFATGIYASIRSIHKFLLFQNFGCADSEQMLHKQSEMWMHNDILSNSKEVLKTTEAELEAAIAKEGELLPLQIDSPMRYFENDQLSKLISTWKAVGSTVYITHIPALDETMLTKTEIESLERQFSNVHYLAIGSDFLSNRLEEKVQFYRDRTHVNIQGAEEISSKFANRLQLLK